MFERWTCPKQCVLEKLSQGPPQGVWRRLVDQNHGAAALTLLTTLGVWCEIVTPLKSIQMTLWHRYSTTNQSVEEVVYVTPLVILRIKSQTYWKLYISPGKQDPNRNRGDAASRSHRLECQHQCMCCAGPMAACSVFDVGDAATPGAAQYC